MKKFLAILDGFQLSQSTIEYAISLSRSEQAHLVGLFPDESVYRSYDMYRVIMEAGDPDKTIENLDRLDELKRQESVRQFQAICEKAGVSFSIHRDRRNAEKSVLEESTYADLLIIDKKERFSAAEEEIPSSFLQKLMASSFCPVLVVPSTYKPVDDIIMLYDGKPSSVYASKQFSYLLPVTSGTKQLHVLTVNPEGGSGNLPNNKAMRDFISHSFPQAAYNLLKGDPETQIKGFIRNHDGNELLIVGAYRRNDLSRWFKISMADVLLKELNNPVFIAHH